jgi:hypothetical protein
MAWGNAFNSACLSLLIATLSFGCGKSKGDGNSGGDNSDDGNWLVGTWLGTYGNKGEGMNLQDPAEARADFGADGNFNIVLTQAPAANASGTWDDYPGEILMLNIKTSSISRLGAANTTQQFHYERRGDKVTIYNDKIILMAKKNGAGNNGTDPATPTNPLIGLWRCTDPSRNAWALEVKSESDFWGTITRDGVKDLVIKGSITAGTDASKEIRFSVTDSNNDSVRGSEFLGVLREGGIMDLSIMSKATDGSITQGDKFSCRK